MKALVLMDSDYDYGYECSYPAGIFFVPNDFDEPKERLKWHEETFKPLTGRNQYGEWKSSKHGLHTKTFTRWLREKYDEIEVLTVELW